MRLETSSLLPAALWAALVAAALLTPGSGASEALAWVSWLVEHGGDKAGHLVLFFGQAFWLSRALADKPDATKPHLWAALAAACYGLMLETAQLAIPTRGFEGSDLVANTAGAFLWPLVWALRLRF